MAIVVLDVNIIVSGFLRGKGAAVTIASLWEHGELKLAVSDHIINQVSRVWEQP